MKTLREEVLQEMQRRNYSGRTIKTYLSCISSLSKYYNQSPDKIDLDQVKAYLHHAITEQGCSVSLVNQTISAVKILHTDILKNEWTPMSIIRPKREKRLPVILSRQEVLAILGAAGNLKHQSILTLGYSSGLRISEVINLQLSHIDSARMQVRVVGSKGRKDRNTVLSSSALTLLRNYYRADRPQYWLFEGRSGKNRQYSTSSIRKVLERASVKAGINKAVTYHSLRHCFATHLLEQGTSLQVIQSLLGHAHISTTNTYLHVRQYNLDQVVSPMDHQL